MDGTWRASCRSCAVSHKGPLLQALDETPHICRGEGVALCRRYETGGRFRHHDAVNTRVFEGFAYATRIRCICEAPDAGCPDSCVCSSAPRVIPHSLPPAKRTDMASEDGRSCIFSAASLAAFRYSSVRPSPHPNSERAGFHRHWLTILPARWAARAKHYNFAAEGLRPPRRDP